MDAQPSEVAQPSEKDLAYAQYQALRAATSQQPAKDVRFAPGETITLQIGAVASTWIIARMTSERLVLEPHDVPARKELERYAGDRRTAALSAPSRPWLQRRGK